MDVSSRYMDWLSEVRQALHGMGASGEILEPVADWYVNDLSPYEVAVMILEDREWAESRLALDRFYAASPALPSVGP